MYIIFLIEIFLLGLLAPFPIFKPIESINFAYFDLCFLITLVSFQLLKTSYPKMSKYYWYLAGIFIFGSTISTFSSINIDFSILHYFQYLYIFLLVIPFMSIFLSNKLQFKVFLAGTGLCSLYLLGNSYYYFLNGLGKFVGGSRFTSFFDSPSGFTWSLLYLFPFLIISPYLIFQKKIKLNKILRGILLLFFSILLILTQSRSGLIACVTGSLIYLWTKNKYIKSKMDSLRRGYFLNSIVVILLIFGCFVFVKLAFGDYLDIYLLRASNSLSEYSDGRFSDFNSITGNMNLKDFILGIGFKNSEFLSERAIRFHNAFVLFFLEGGLLTGISIVLMMYYYFSQGIKSLILSKKNFDQYSLLLGIISIFIFSVIMMLNTQSIHRMYWIGFAIVEAYSKRISSDIRS